MSAMTLYVEGVGLWSAQVAGLADLARLLAGEPITAPPARPPAATLPANERRRAPENVLLAAEVAGQAVAMSGREAATLVSVFSSSHGDQSITDYMCATLASAPTELSPTRFHNSVHNAPAGYWTMATHCHEASNAVCAHHESFGAGLLEAATQALTDQVPVLLVCSDVPGRGPLGEVTGCTAAFGCALVLAPAASDRAMVRLDLRLLAGHAPPRSLPAPLQALREASPSAPALDLLSVLARGGDGHCAIAVAPQLELRVDVAPLATGPASA